MSLDRRTRRGSQEHRAELIALDDRLLSGAEPLSSIIANIASTSDTEIRTTKALLVDLHRVFRTNDSLPIGPQNSELEGDCSAECKEKSKQVATKSEPDTVRKEVVPPAKLGRDSAASAQRRKRRWIGQFRIVRRLGIGGCGVVYLAFDPQLKRRVAVKVPRRDLTTAPEAEDRMRREAQAAARLDHPNVVRILQTSPANERLYLVLEYCDQGNLAEWLKNRNEALAPRTAALLVAALADGVAHAHAHNIVHRDIKPNNVLLSSAPTSPEKDELAAILRVTPKIADFGLAKDALGPTLTASGARVGTVNYMSPEQASGTASLLGPSTDVHALGVLLYELIVGKPPYQGETELETLRRIQEDVPILPRELRLEIPCDLATICLKCLDKEPCRRYGSAAALAEDLRRFCVGQPITANRIGILETAWRRMKRRPAVAALWVMGILAIVTIIGANAFYQDRLEVAHHQLRSAKSDQRRSQYVESIRTARAHWQAGEFESAEKMLARCSPLDGESDQRGFEWHYLRTLLQPPEETVWKVNDRHIVGGVFSDVEGFFAAPGADGVLRLLSTRTGRIERAIDAGGLDLRGAAVSGSCRFLASGNKKGAVRVWDAPSGKLLQLLQASNSSITATAFLCDDKLLAAASEDGVSLWNIEKGTLFKRLDALVGKVEDLAIGPDSSVATVGQDKYLRIWEPQSFVKRAEFKHPQPAICVTWAKDDGYWIATGCDDGCVRVFDSATLQLRWTFPGRNETIRCVAADRQGRWVAAGDKGGWVRIWDVRTGELLRVIRQVGQRIWVLAFSPDDESLISGGFDGVIKAWKVQDLVSGRVAYRASAAIGSIAFDATGDRMVIGSDKVVVAPTKQLDRDESLALCLAREGAASAFVPGKNLLAVGYGKGTILLVNDTTGRIEQRLTARGGPTRSLAISPDGSRIAVLLGAVSYVPGGFHLWDANNGAELQIEPRIPGESGVVAFAPNGKLLAIAGEGGALGLCDPATGKVEMKLPASNASANAIAWSPDSKCLAVAGLDHRVTIWEAATGQVIWTSGPMIQTPLSLAFAPDGRTLAVGGDDRTVRLWATDTWQETIALPTSNPLVSAVAFGSDCRTLAAGSWLAPHPSPSPQGEVYLWRISTNQ